MIAEVGLLMSSFRACVADITLSVLSTLVVMLPTRIAGTTPVCLVVVLFKQVPGEASGSGRDHYWRVEAPTGRMTTHPSKKQANKYIVRR